MLVSNWGLYPSIDAIMLSWGSGNSLRKILSNNASVIARGMGRCYGDSSLNEVILSSLRGNKILSFDPANGVLRCEAGLTLAEILEIFVPRGWFPPVVPGTKFITMGGAIAADVHGKNHHIEGSFTKHLLEMEIMLADGSLVTCSRTNNADLFLATCGGMGLTGLIINVTFAMKPVTSSYIRMESIKAANLDELMALLAESEKWTYTVAWIDCLAKGRNLGRGILMRGEHAGHSDIHDALPLTPAPKRLHTVPFHFPNVALNSFTISLFNTLYFYKQFSKKSERLSDYESFFFPLDSLNHWNRIYGRRGFLQYQFVLPKESGEAGLKQILEAIVRAGSGSFLAVLKWFGPQGDGLISFPRDGFTLALDFPLVPGLLEFFKRLDQLVVEFGGRLYLAKDARMNGAMFREGYERHKRFMEIKREIDPFNKFQSLQSRRLEVAK